MELTTISPWLCGTGVFSFWGQQEADTERPFKSRRGRPYRGLKSPTLSHLSKYQRKRQREKVGSVAGEGGLEAAKWTLKLGCRGCDLTWQGSKVQDTVFLRGRTASSQYTSENTIITLIACTRKWSVSMTTGLARGRMLIRQNTGTGTCGMPKHYPRSPCPKHSPGLLTLRPLLSATRLWGTDPRPRGWFRVKDEGLGRPRPI